MGESGSRLGRYRKAPAVDVPVGREPDDACHVARQLRRRDGRGASCRKSPRAILAVRPATTRLAASVYRRGSPGQGLSYAQAARRAIELGGKYDGHELPEDINVMTRESATALTGLGLMGVAKDNHPRDGVTYSFVIGFAEVEVDVETGQATWLIFSLSVMSAR